MLPVELLNMVPREHFDFDSHTCKYAAENSLLNCQQFAPENSCDWNRTECLSIARDRKYSHMRFFRKSNSIHTDMLNIRETRIKIFQYLLLYNLNHI